MGFVWVQGLGFRKKKKQCTRPSASTRSQQARSETKRFLTNTMARCSTCFHGKCTMTHHHDTRFAHILTPALPSCLQIACCINVDFVNVNKAFCVGAHVHCMPACVMPACVHCARMPCTFLHLPCPYLCASSACALLPCFLCLYRFESSASCVRSAPSGCTQAPLHMWVHAYLYCALYNKRWALLRFSDICVPA